MPDNGARVDESSKDGALIRRRKIAMIEAGVTGSSIAHELGISKQAVSQVVNGHRHTREVQHAIAHACGVAFETLFPPNDALAADAA